MQVKLLTTYSLLLTIQRTAPGAVRVGDDARGLARVVGAAEVVEHAWGCMMGAYEYKFRVDTTSYRVTGWVRGGAGGVQWGCSGSALGVQWGCSGLQWGCSGGATSKLFTSSYPHLFFGNLLGNISRDIVGEYGLEYVWEYV